MDRGKTSQGRGGKSKTPQYPADIFALGTKSSRLESTDSKRPPGVVHGKPSTSHALPGTDRKRDTIAGPLSSTIVPAKKSKPSGSLILGRGGGSGAAEAWEMVAEDCDPADLVPAVLEASDLDEADKVVGLLCGAVRSLRNQRWKPDQVTYVGLLFLAKLRPSLFSTDCIVHALCSLLRRDPSHSFKSKGNPWVSVVAANLLMKGFQDKKPWPELFLKLYVEDSLGDRVWVDQEECSGFVNNIVTALNTRTPPRSMLQPEQPVSACPSPIMTPDEEGEGLSTGTDVSTPADPKEKMDIRVQPRYANCQESVEAIVMEAVREQLNRRQPTDSITRNFLRLLSASCGLVEVRLAASARLEIWLQNPKLMRPAQELFMAVCLNCSSHTQKDVEVVSHLVKIRLKTKALINLYLAGIRELISAHPDNLATLLKHTIYNELSTARNPNNMAMLAVMFQTGSDHAATILAEIFQDLLMNRDDYLRPLRALLREIVRVLRHDMDLISFCRGLMQDRKDFPQFRDFEFKERMFTSVADLITLCIFLAISPAVREASTLLARGDKREITTLNNFQMQVAKIQRDAVWWLHESAMKMYRPSPADFVHALHKVLFMEHQEQYYNKDTWPPENDRNLMLRLASEVPVLQHALIRIFLIGLSKEHPLAPPDTLELADQLVKRAAALPSEGFPLLQMDKLEIIDLVFNLSAYHHPDNINLPTGYCPPKLAITNSYWKAWIMLLILSAHNPATFGTVAWEKYPTLRAFMEMSITNHFTYPPPTMSSGEVLEDVKNKELQVAALEKQQILEFESHLAAASTKQTITEQTSLLLTQLITMDPTGPPRRPPQSVLEQLQTLNTTHRMGHLLCRSRHPDFLLDIIQRQGASQSMPWLADLVENSEGALSHLPVQCLCEFLLSSSSLVQPEKQHKHQQLLQHLQTVLTDVNQDPTAPCEVLEYFLRRLSSPQTSSRAQAIKGLKQILSSVAVDEETMDVEMLPDPNNDSSWLLRQLPLLPHFPTVRPQVVQALRQACQVENDPTLVSCYICFLAVHTQDDTLAELAELVLDMAQLIVERSSIVAAILPSPDHDIPAASSTQHALMVMFCSYLQKAREPRREAYTWSESQDQILVTWSNGEESTMHILVVHAIIILLNYGPGQDVTLFENMLDVWFPLDKEPPKAYLVDTSEEALLIPDWLKLRMIRSNVDRLVDAALTDLEPPQLVLFIQSFGIPVKSMSKLLHTLDAAVTADPLSVGEAVLDKSYMAQLVEVQHLRGAEGGQALVQVLRLEQPKLPEYLQLSSSSVRQPLPAVMELEGSSEIQAVTDGQVADLLVKIFNPQQTTVTQKQLAFKTLQKTLTQEMKKTSVSQSVLLTTIGSLHKALSSPSADQFAQFLANSLQFTGPLLRLLITASNQLPPPAVAKLVEICSKLVVKPSLKGVVKSFLIRHDARPKKAPEPKTTDAVAVLQHTPLLKLERAGCRLLDEGLQQHQTEQLVECMARLLVTDAVPERTGLLIDWLVSVDSELIGSSQALQMQLLFSKPNAETKEKLPAMQSCRPYLLTLLTHRASWATLYHCMQNLLASCNDRYDPTSVLDFLWALTCNPKLWQGREKFTPKHHTPEDILCLSVDQRLVLVEYMVEEAVSQPQQASVEKMEARLPLLLQCTSTGRDMASVTHHLVQMMTAKKGAKSQLAQKLLLQLYLRIPSVIQHLVDVEMDLLLDGACVTEWSSSLLDGMSHTLLTALTASQQSKDWTRRSQEYELLARKMASVHPVLVLRDNALNIPSVPRMLNETIAVTYCLIATALSHQPDMKQHISWQMSRPAVLSPFHVAARTLAQRQLRMLAASLCGRVHLDFAVFRARNHLATFTQVLGLLELLETHIFLREHSSGLQATLDSYFALFKYHGHMKDLISLLTRFVTFLHNFISHDAQCALKYLQRHAHVLSDLQLCHPNLAPLRSLLAGISIPKSDEEGGEVLVAVAAPPPPVDPSPNLVPMLAALSKPQGDDVYATLQDLDHLSSRKPSVLEMFVDSLAKLMLSPTYNVRLLAHVLLVRYLRHNPAASATSAGLAAYERCLESEQPDVLQMALDRLPEIVLCMQEHALPLLQKVFRLGMYSVINTVPHISKTIALLNVQSGC